MEVKAGSIPLIALAITFIGLQIWWIKLTLSNSKEARETLNDKISEKEVKKDKLKEKKEELERIFKK